MNMMKNRLVFLLIACFMMCIAAPAAMADTTAQGIVYQTENGNTVITGYTGTDTTVVIPSQIDGTPVTAIGKNAFEGCTSLKSIEIPDSVTKFDNSAFEGCTSLESVTLPNGTTTIHNSMFKGCTSLKSIEIPDSVTGFENSVFEGCTSLESVKLPNGIETIHNSMFKGCTSLKSIIIPNSVTEFENSAFEGCTSLESVTLPNDINIIDNSMFKGCTSLESVIIPANVTKMEPNVFTDCTNLTTIEFLGKKPPMFENFSWCDPTTVNVIYVPHEAVEDYQAVVGDTSTNKVRCKKHDAAICPTEVTVSVISSAGGSSTGSGTYPIDDTVMLTATPDTGYTFAGWQVNGQIVSTSQTYSFIAVKDVTVTALFEKMPVLPQTGDDSNVILWSALACISLFGMMTLVRKRKEA